jgi:hypothetical protein
MGPILDVDGLSFFPYLILLPKDDDSIDPVIRHYQIPDRNRTEFDSIERSYPAIPLRVYRDNALVQGSCRSVGESPFKIEHCYLLNERLGAEIL